MSEKPIPGRSDSASSKEERLSAALRENLKRRKAQSRQRRNQSPPESDTADKGARPEKEPEKDKN